MFDWNKQADDVLQAWTDTNKRLFKTWGETVAQQTGQPPVAETWRKAVDGWEGAVKNGLDVQLEWSRSAGDSLRALPNVPKELLDWAEQTQELGTRWSAAQRQLWESYFGMVRKAIPAKMMDALDDENQKLFRAWQDAVEQVTAANTSWSQTWTAAEPAKRQTRAKATAS